MTLCVSHFHQMWLLYDLLISQAQIEQFETRSKVPTRISSAVMQLNAEALKDHMGFEMPSFGNGRVLRDYQEVG